MYSRVQLNMYHRPWSWIMMTELFSLILLSWHSCLAVKLYFVDNVSKYTRHYFRSEKFLIKFFFHFCNHNTVKLLNVLIPCNIEIQTTRFCICRWTIVWIIRCNYKESSTSQSLRFVDISYTKLRMHSKRITIGKVNSHASQKLHHFLNREFLTIECVALRSFRFFGIKREIQS